MPKTRIELSLTGKESAKLTIKIKCKTSRKANLPAIDDIKDLLQIDTSDRESFSSHGLAGHAQDPFKTKRRRFKYNLNCHSLFTIADGVVQDNNTSKGNDSSLSVDIEHVAYCNWKSYYILGDFDGLKTMMETHIPHSIDWHLKNSSNNWNGIGEEMQRCIATLLNTIEEYVYSWNHYHASNGTLYDLIHHKPNLKYGSMEEYLTSKEYPVVLQVPGVIGAYFTQYGYFDGTK